MVFYRMAPAFDSASSIGRVKPRVLTDRRVYVRIPSERAFLIVEVLTQDGLVGLGEGATPEALESRSLADLADKRISR